MYGIPHTHTHTLLAPCCWLAQMNVWLAAGASDDAWGLYTGMITNCKCILQPLHTKGTTYFKHYNVIYMLRGWKSWLAHCRRIRRGPRIVLPKQILQQNLLLLSLLLLPSSASNSTSSWSYILTYCIAYRELCIMISLHTWRDGLFSFMQAYLAM